MHTEIKTPLIAIACGGTGGHLFPGLAVAEELGARGANVMLLVSPKEVDQQAVRTIRGMRVETLPAVGLTRGGFVSFAVGFWKSYRAARTLFKATPPAAVLSMGGFTSVPPVIAGGRLGAKAFLHESNTIPGKANRLLAHFVDDAFVYFSETTGRLNHQKVKVTGMPVRSQFASLDAASCRMAIGLQPNRPVLLVMGGSQGASGINDLLIKTLPQMATLSPELQYLHLTGPADLDKVRTAYRNAGVKAVVQPFLSEMELALGAATVAISRAGASSLAELAATRIPSILIPYPTAADNHQFFNARAFVDSGAARMMEQANATPDQLRWLILELAGNAVSRAAIIQSLEKWHQANATVRVADLICEAIDFKGRSPQLEDGQGMVKRPMKPVSPREVVHS
ncbi:MAG TPA: undecaprenyldiphospho-muramoylpentapeptide beta-N-acetylglucosaminyltransferase [Roseimicrobium sp.]|nr:undecaprenyldiphospho-muramoylpentapeptide beta-N-acetylglucosaminyltransferase [Roseimicrobium sp.]